MNAEIQNMIGILIHVAKSDEFLDHEGKKVLKNIIYRYSRDSEDLKKFKMYMWITIGCAAIFLIVKYFEYSHKIHEGFIPSHDVYMGLYFTMTGVENDLKIIVYFANEISVFFLNNGFSS